MNKEEKAYCDTLLENNDFVKLVTFEVMLETRYEALTLEEALKMSTNQLSKNELLEQL